MLLLFCAAGIVLTDPCAVDPSRLSAVYSQELVDYMTPGRVNPARTLSAHTPTLVFVMGEKQLISRMTIKNSILAETEGGRENEPERMSGRARGRVGGITTGKSRGG